MSASILGIDLGTSNTVAAIMESGAARVIINDEGGRTTPSVVGYGADGEVLVGSVARRQMLLHPTRTIHSAKRLMGRSWADHQAQPLEVGYAVVPGPDKRAAIRVDERTLAPQEVAASVLRHVHGQACAQLGREVSDVVITVPAWFDDLQRQATVEAGQIAGLNVIRVINEPTAAALACMAEESEVSGRVAVFDFGGGTFDISLVELDEGVAEVLSTAGNNFLGGVDLDARIVGWLVEQFEAEHGIPLEPDPLVQQRIREAAERVKCELSSAHESRIHLPFLMADEQGPRHLQVTLTRSRFEELVEDLLQSTLTECQKVLEDAKLSPDDIGEVLMVGGSARIPRVEELVRDFFGCPLNKRLNPDEAVAIGAALHAGELSGEFESARGVQLLDVTSHSLGIEIDGGFFATIVPRNTLLPVQRSRTVSTASDNQSAVRIHILQGEARRVRQNTSLGDFKLGGIPKAKRGEPRIVVTFAIDTNGMVQVSASDERSGRSHTLTVERPAAMGPAQLEEARQRVEEGESLSSISDLLAAEQRERSDVENDILAELKALERFVDEQGPRLRTRDLQDLEQAIKRGRATLERSRPEDQLREMRSYFQRYRKAMQDRLYGERHGLD